MLETIFVLIRAFALACRGHRAIILESITLRHQLRTLQPRVKRPPLRPRDRLFWILLVETWRDSRSALVLVQPDTVVRCHRDWLRCRWARRSKPGAMDFVISNGFEAVNDGVGGSDLPAHTWPSML